jgi:hypothetical protein
MPDLMDVLDKLSWLKGGLDDIWWFNDGEDTNDLPP